MLQLALLAIGAGAGGLGALLGVGGGVILVPALIFLAGVPFPAAVGTSLVCVVATSVAGSAVQFGRGMVDPQTALRLQAYAAGGAVVAGLLAPVVPIRALFVAFGALLLAVAWRSWPRHETPAPAVAAPHGALARAAAGAGGVIGGLLGVGGGIVFMPLLHLLAGLEFHRAAATVPLLVFGLGYDHGFEWKRTDGLGGSSSDASSTTRSGARWTGRASVARALLPSPPLKCNAYRVAGVGPTRRWQALVAVPGERPDFHRLDRFVPWPL